MTNIMANNQVKAGFHPVYILAVLYTASVYLFPFVFFKVNQNVGNENGLLMWPLLIPLILGLFNLIVILIGKNKISRDQLLNCAILIKYALVPFYIFGGLCIALALLFMLTPVVIMVFIGPAIAMTFSVLGWLAILGAAPFSVAYIIKSSKQGIHGKTISKIACVFQFFFMLDVFSIMILALKEKKCVKITIALLSILLFAILISGIWLMVTIAGMLF